MKRKATAFFAVALMFTALQTAQATNIPADKAPVLQIQPLTADAQVETQQPIVLSEELEVKVPTVEAPAVEVEEPVVEAPAVEVEEPVVEAPTTEVEEPAVEAPVVEAEEPTVEAPATEVEEPIVEAPATAVEEPVIEVIIEDEPVPAAAAPEIATVVVTSQVVSDGEVVCEWSYELDAMAAGEKLNLDQFIETDATDIVFAGVAGEVVVEEGQNNFVLVYAPQDGWTIS